MKIALLLLSFFVFSCGKSPAPQQQTGAIQTLQLPDWVIDPYIEGTISAVGIAPKTAGGIKMQIAQAEADAKGNMAAQIQTKVSRVTKESLRRSGVATEAGEKEAVDSYFAQATKSVVKEVPLIGAKRRNIFQSPVDGTLYVQMYIDQDPVKEYLQESAKNVASGLKDFNSTQKTIKQTEESMKELFDEIDFSKKD